MFCSISHHSAGRPPYSVHLHILGIVCWIKHMCNCQFVNTLYFVLKTIIIHTHCQWFVLHPWYFWWAYNASKPTVGVKKKFPLRKRCTPVERRNGEINTQNARAKNGKRKNWNRVSLVVKRKLRNSNCTTQLLVYRSTIVDRTNACTVLARCMACF